MSRDIADALSSVGLIPRLGGKMIKGEIQLDDKSTLKIRISRLKNGAATLGRPAQAVVPMDSVAA